MITVIPKDAYHLYAPVLPEGLTAKEGLMIGAFDGNTLEGILFASPAGPDVWQIDHLYVVTDSRRRGIGSDLLETCRRNTQTYGAHTLRADCLFDGDGPGEDLDAFLLNRGFSLMSETAAMQTTLGALADGAGRFIKYTGTGDIRFLPDMDDTTWDHLTEYLAMTRRMRNEGDTVTFLYPRDMYHPGLSRFVTDEDGRLTDILLIRAYGESLSIDYMWCAGALGSAMARLISTAIMDAQLTYPGDTPVTCHVMNPMAGRIAHKLTSGEITQIGVVRKYRC